MPHTYWNTFNNASQSTPLLQQVSNVLQSVVDRFGILLPLTLITILILGFVYNDRLIFQPGERSGVTEIPGALPLIGHTHHIIKFGTVNQFHRFQEFSNLAPTNTYHLTFAGAGSIIMVNRPEYLEYIQKTNFENYPKGVQFRDKLGDLLGHDGIFVADGDIWKTQRKMASHMFSANQFNNWVKVVVHNELNTIDTILKKVSSQKQFSIQGLDGTASAKSPSIRGGKINMSELFFRYTLSSFAKMAFGSDLGCLTEDPASIENPHPFAVAFDFSQGVMNKRFVNPLWQLFELLTPEGAQMRKSIKLIRNFGKAIIQQRLKEAGIQIEGIDLNEKSEFSQDQLHKSTLQNSEGSKDLLALFMEQTQDPEALLTVVLNFMIAGRDTTAQTLSWLFYELCANPQHVELIREEVDRVLGPDAADQKVWVEYTEYKKLPYTLACFHEAARLHPSVPKNGKEVIKDDVIIPQGPNPHNLPPFKVFASERIGWSDWVMNRIPEVWGEDANEFNPKRFLQQSSNGDWTYVQPSQWKFHVFNAGPRLCLGMNLAGFEGVSFVASMLQKYDFTWASKQQGQTSDWPPTYANSVTHPMKDPYQCIITPRSRK